MHLNFLVVGNKLFFASENSASASQEQMYVLDAGSNRPMSLDTACLMREVLTK